MRFFDSENNRLLYFRSKADNKYWDQHWKNTGVIEILKNPPKHRTLRRLTARFLKPPAKILEGGCGMGDKVLALDKAGYQSYGVDFAEETVDTLLKVYPDLKVSVSDVRNLTFDDCFFDGYWSLGVIEHFYDGYHQIAKEMHRVIKKKGYLFLTFPMMSYIRKLKSKKNLYEKFISDENDSNSFYQFALDPDIVKKEIESLGFSLKCQTGFDSLKGIKDEFSVFHKVLTFLIKKNPRMTAILGVLLDKLIGKVCGHMAIMVFQKK